MGILSFQSHVATGRVGNAIVAFALQRLGHEVWPVHTVLFSNHPGRGGFRGKVRAAEDLREIVHGLNDQGVFARCDAILGGYLGGAASGAVLLDAVGTVRAVRPDATFYLDPVMGDAGKGVYVADDVVEFYRSSFSRADVLAPNAFELGVLAGRPIGGVADAVGAARSLMGDHLRTVFVTSVDGVAADDIATVAVTPDRAFAITTPRLDIDPKGAGDLFMALVAAEAITDPDPQGHLERAVGVVWALSEAAALTGADADLPIIECQDLLVSPPREFTAYPVWS